MLTILEAARADCTRSVKPASLNPVCRHICQLTRWGILQYSFNTPKVVRPGTAVGRGRASNLPTLEHTVEFGTGAI